MPATNTDVGVTEDLHPAADGPGGAPAPVAMSHPGDEPRLLALDGEMTIYRAAELKQILLASLSTPGALDIDLHGVTELDSAGVQLLILVKQLARTRSTPLRLVRCSPGVREVLELLNLSLLTDSSATPSTATPNDAVAIRGEDSVAP